MLAQISFKAGFRLNFGDSLFTKLSHRGYHLPLGDDMAVDWTGRLKRFDDQLATDAEELKEFNYKQELLNTQGEVFWSDMLVQILRVC